MGDFTSLGLSLFIYKMGMTAAPHNGSARTWHAVSAMQELALLTALLGTRALLPELLWSRRGNRRPLAPDPDYGQSTVPSCPVGLE